VLQGGFCEFCQFFMCWAVFILNNIMVKEADKTRGKAGTRGRTRKFKNAVTQEEEVIFCLYVTAAIRLPSTLVCLLISVPFDLYVDYRPLHSFSGVLILVWFNPSTVKKGMSYTRGPWLQGTILPTNHSPRCTKPPRL
jgi:hypothetical protein